MDTQTARTAQMKPTVGQPVQMALFDAGVRQLETGQLLWTEVDLFFRKAEPKDKRI